MKHFPRLEQFRTTPDPTSAFLREFRYDVDYFTHWPQQSRKTLNNIVSPRIKLVLQKSGESILTAQNKQFSIGPYSLLYLPPYTVYSAVTFDEVDSYELFFNIHPITREQEFLHQLGLDGVLLFSQLLTPQDFDQISACFDAIHLNQEGAYAQLQSLLSLLLIRVCRTRENCHPAVSAGSRERAVIERVFAYLSAHIDQPVQIAAVCQELELSQSYLYRCCRSVMNCSPSQLITRQKLTHAQTLLKNPDLTISSVAEAIGYDPYYFSNQFKKLFLVSPSEFRKNQR